MDISKFLNMDSNDLLSKMNEKDKNELLELLKMYKISLRDKLNLDSNASFGLEFELGTDNPNRIDSNLKSLNYRYLLAKRLENAYWESKRESSFSDGHEVISPILFDTEETWKQVADVCKLIEDNGGSIDGRCAGHIHLGTQIVGNDFNSWINFLRLYVAYEDIIYRFSYGEFENRRPYTKIYAYPLSKRYNEKIKELEDEFYTPSLTKFFKAIHPIHKKESLGLYGVNNGGTSYERNRTIEFRMPNASLEPVIWQNNVNFFANLLKSSRKDLDLDKLREVIKKKEEKGMLSNLEEYFIIDVDSALELSDIIFDNNLDKINFLRQYMKGFMEEDRFVKSPVFIKK